MKKGIETPPAVFITIDDYRKFARNYLTKAANDYYESGADEEKTLSRNEKAFDRLLIRPRCLRSVEHINTRCKWIGGVETKFPIAFAPTAFHRMASVDGEISTVRAAGRTDSLMICSSWGTTSITDIGREAKAVGASLWFQLYVYRDRKVTEALIRRAESAGVKALVLTVDTPVLGRRIADVVNGFSLPNHLKFANFDSNESQSQMPEGNVGKSGFMDYVCSQIDPTLNWDTVKWIKERTKLPLIIKGLVRGDDAKLALENGVDGIIVSNHGGRQLDSAPGTIECLPEVIKTVNGRIPVYLDGGIRNGRDIFKAIALGANGIFIGRPVLWGLATAGTQGVANVTSILQNEFHRTMQLSGYRSIEELQCDRNCIVNVSKL